MKYAVIIEKTQTGYSAYVPDLPGCVSVGHTREEMDHNIREAIELYLDELREQGAAIPVPTNSTTGSHWDGPPGSPPSPPPRLGCHRGAIRC